MPDASTAYLAEPTYDPSGGPDESPEITAELMSAVMRGMVAKAAGLRVTGVVVPASWPDWYANRITEVYAEKGITDTQVIRSSDTTSFGLIV